MQHLQGLDATGAIIIGKRMFGGWDGPWGDEPTLGVWGENPPFDVPVFVLTHYEREPLTIGHTTFTFVSDGIESALEQARVAAGGKDVSVGGGVRLLDDLGEAPPKLERTQVVEPPSGVTHLRYGL